MLTRSKKARLEKTSGLAGPPRNDATYYPKSDVESQKGKAVVLGSEEVGSPYHAGSIANGSQSIPGCGIL